MSSACPSSQHLTSSVAAALLANRGSMSLKQPGQEQPQLSTYHQHNMSRPTNLYEHLALSNRLRRRQSLSLLSSTAASWKPHKARGTVAKPWNQQQQLVSPVVRRGSKCTSTGKVSKTVTFAPTLTVQTRSMTEHDLQNAWYSSRDYQRFSEERRQTLLNAATVEDPLELLGLEHYHSESLSQRSLALQRKLDHVRHVHQVLEKQYWERQRYWRMMLQHEDLLGLSSQYHHHPSYSNSPSYTEAVLHEALNL